MGKIIRHGDSVTRRHGENPIGRMIDLAKGQDLKPKETRAWFTGMKGIRGIRENATTIIPA